MRATKTKDGWLAEEPMGWVLAMLVMGCNSGFLFGFNGVRAAMDGHPIGAVAIMGVGASMGCWCVWSALTELWRRCRRREK